MEPVLQHLSDGTAVWLRLMRPQDAGLLVQGFGQLSAESRAMRFLTGIPELTEQMVRYLTNVDGVNHVAIVAVVGEPAGEHGAGVARYFRLSGEPTAAEAAVTVIDRYQRKGLGTLLLKALASEARAGGIEVFRALAAHSNRAIVRFADKAGGTVRSADGGMLVEVPLRVDVCDPRSRRGGG